MLSLTLQRYYSPLRLPLRPAAISDSPYTQRLTLLTRHRNGPPVLHCFSSTACRPCYPGKLTESLPFSQPGDNGLPLLTTGSASSLVERGYLQVRSRYGLLLCALRNLQPPITQTLLLGTKKVNGQLLSRDFNPQEKQPITAYGPTRYSCYVASSSFPMLSARSRRRS